MITPEGVVTPFLRIQGHDGSEIAGPAFALDGRRLCFSSQRWHQRRSAGTDGSTFVVTGPFRTT